MADQRNVSAGIVAESEERSYSCVFKVHGYSRLKELFKTGEYVASSPFSVEGDNWVLRYYPNGQSARVADYISLLLDSVDGEHVNAEVSDIRVLGDYGTPSPLSYSSSMFQLRLSLEPGSRGSYPCVLIIREKLEQSGDIVDDSFSIKCDFALKKDIHSEQAIGNQFVAVPPTDLHLHFGNLLDTMDGADVTFHVGGEKFLAHRLVLAARSSVFKAELLGAMNENVGSPIEILEMEADVFKSLIHFIYTDSLPALQMVCNQGEARPDMVMAGHLLVAADRYNVERLKLICEHKLCSHIDANMVADSLALAEQHSCNGLKEACLQFLASPSNLEAMITSDGYQHLKVSCPTSLRELIVRLLPVELKAAKDIVMSI